MSEKTFALDGPVNLVARIGHGSITVTARADLSTAVVRLTARDPESSILDRIAVEMQGPTLAVIGPRQGGLPDLFHGWDRDRDAVDADITVPAGTAMRIMTSSAAVDVHGRAGGADVATGTGDIRVETVDGDLRLRTGSAAVRVGVVTGDLTIRNGSGDASVDEARGGIECGCGSGDLVVRSAGGRVRSRTGSGDVRIGVANGDLDLTAGSGEVTVGIPSGVSARLDVRTGSGRVHTALPIEDAATSASTITVRARTGTGDIRLFRAA